MDIVPEEIILVIYICGIEYKKQKRLDRREAYILLFTYAGEIMVTMDSNDVTTPYF